MKENEYNCLILGGGATKGFGTLGAIQYLMDQNLLKNIDTIVGTSVGAIIGYLYAIGFTPVELMIEMVRTKILEELAVFDIQNVLAGHGAADYSKIHTLIEELTINKIGKLISLKELKDEFGITLICCTYNLTTKKAEYIDYTNNPGMQCTVLIRMSSSVPFIFGRYKYNESYYIDGGVADNFPIQLLDNGKNMVIGIHLAEKNDGEKINSEFNVFEHFYNIISIFMNQKYLHKIKNISNNCKIINLEIEVNPINFGLSNQKKLDIFSQGYKKAKLILENDKHHNLK